MKRKPNKKQKKLEAWFKAGKEMQKLNTQQKQKLEQPKPHTER